MNKAIAVFSGGLDCTVAASVYAKDYEIHAITFNYGQKAFEQEINASQKICEKMGFKHHIINLDWLSKISTSSLKYGFLQEILYLHPLLQHMQKA